MTMLSSLKRRYPKAFSAMTLVLGLAAAAGVAAYEERASANESCCYPGAPCCHPGAACCKGHEQAAK